MRKSLLLRKSEGSYNVEFHVYYDEVPGYAPDTHLIEKDILAPLFDSVANPKYTVRAPRIEVELADFGAALERYYDLVRNWKATETYIHPHVFRFDKRWVEGARPNG